MKITPNYNVNYLKFSQKIRNNDGQTEPNELSQPAFKMNLKMTGVIGAAASAAITPAVTGGMEAAKNIDKKEEEIPTREEFEKILTLEENLPDDTKQEWLNAYDIDAKNTIAFYNLKDNEGNRFIDDYKQNDIGMYIDTIAENMDKVFKNPQLVKEIVNIEDVNGLKLFDFNNALDVTDFVAEYPDGFKLMMTIKDKNGDFRFKNPESFRYVSLFEENPELAVKYANMTDKTGYPRFYLYTIKNLIELNKFYDSKDIDSALELKRDDGSYIFDEAPIEAAMEALRINPKEFLELCNLRVPNRDKYLQPNHDTSTRTLVAYRNYPEATKTLLQMPNPDVYNQTRFKQEDINIGVAKVFEKAPKSFLALSGIKDKGDLYRFNSTQIYKFIHHNDLKEFDKATLKAIHGLSKIEYLKDGKWQRWKKLDEKQIIEGIEAYKAYPKETKYIIQHYLRTSPEYKQEPYVPTVRQVGRFINDRKNFEFGLTKVEL